MIGYAKDGGNESTVWGWFVEFKNAFSVVLLHFTPGSRDAYHSHAFHSVSWVLRGRLEEHNISPTERSVEVSVNAYTPSIIPVLTRRHTFHKVISIGHTWVLSFRGPWAKKWNEYLPQSESLITLADGRRIV